jgi:glycosyltransferase involved in cell wall biosynthesis
VGLRCTIRIPYEVPVLPGGMLAHEIVQRQSVPHSLHFIFVGRLETYKRVDHAIRAFQELNDSRYSGWRFTIVGDGSQRIALQTLAAKDPRISFTGPIPYNELGSFFLNADVLVLPSDHEPWGLVVNEALGFGLYAIVSDSVGCGVDLINETNGLVYPTNDVAKLSSALASCLHRLARTPQDPKTDTAVLMHDAINAIWTARGGAY